MTDDEIEARLRELGLPSPPAEARARVLSACGREMARRRGWRGRPRPLGLKLAVALAALVAADVAANVASNASMAAATAPSAVVASAPHAQGLAEALRARSRMVALLLHEPSGM
jgi:hypothetical protein